MANSSRSAAKQALLSLWRRKKSKTFDRKSWQIPNRVSGSPAEKSKRFLLSGFDNHISGKVQPGYSNRSMSVNTIKRSWLMGCRRPTCFRTLRTDGKNEHATLFLKPFPIQDLHCADMLLSNQSVLYSLYVVCVYRAAGDVNENVLMTDLSQACDKGLQLKTGPYALLFCAEHRGEVLLQDCMILHGFANPMQAQPKMGRALNQSE